MIVIFGLQVAVIHLRGRFAHSHPLALTLTDC